MLKSLFKRAAFLTAALLLTKGLCTVQAAQLKQVADGFVSPVALAPLPDGSQRVLIADQTGQIYLLGQDGQKSLFFDIAPRLTPKMIKGFDEKGLIGLTLHPKFRSNKRLFVCYSGPLRASAPATNWNHTMTISEFKVTGKGADLKLDETSEKQILFIDKPDFNHNAGAIAFGPDGFLYISVGDGGTGNDQGLGHSPKGNGQDTSVLLGKMLRIDVDRPGKGMPYGIPKDNPFVKGNGRPEIFAYGLRNSWRMSFDRGGKHELFAGEIGQDMYEEVNIIVKGANYGWNVREGFHCFDPKRPTTPPKDCPDKDEQGKPFTNPIFEYRNSKGALKDPTARGVSVIGGYVYRGKALPELKGQYVFADWSRNFVIGQGILLTATRPKDAAAQWAVESLKLTSHPNSTVPAFIVAMGEDAEGELYVMTNNSNSLLGTTGKIYKIVP